MAKQWGQMTEQENNLYQTIKAQGETGMPVSQMCQEMGISRAAVYIHLKRLVDYGRVAKKVKRRDGQAVYAADQSSVMHVLPGAGASLPALPVASYLKSWQSIDDINKTASIKYFKRFPAYVSQMAQIARRWNSDDPQDRPFKSEINELRDNLTAVSVRAKLMHEMAESLLHEPTLWNSQKAYHSWYGDTTNVFLPETAKIYHEHLEKLLEGQ